MPEYITKKIAVPRQVNGQEVTNSKGQIVFADPVILVDEQGEFYSSSSAGGNTGGGSNSSGNLNIARNNTPLTFSHLLLENANSEYFISLTNVIKYSIKNLSDSSVRFSNVPGKVATSSLPYYVIDGTEEEKEQFDLDSKFTGTLYFASSVPNALLLLKLWSSPTTSSMDSGFYFAYGDVSQQLVYTTEANEIILTITVVILEAFNATGASISIGDSLDNSRLANNTQIYLDQVGEYSINPSYKYTSSTSINLYFNVGSGGTQGNGYILIETNLTN